MVECVWARRPRGTNEVPAPFASSPPAGSTTPPATQVGSPSPLSDRDLLLAWGPDPEPAALAIVHGAVGPRPRRIELETSRLSREEALRVCALLRAAAGNPAAPSLDTMEVDSGEPSDEGGVAIGGPAGVTFVPPEEEVANAENALALAPAGSADAEPPAAAGGSRPQRDQSEGALVMHRTRRTVHRASCKFARRMCGAARVDLTSEPAAGWLRCRFCCPL